MPEKTKKILLLLVLTTFAIVAGQLIFGGSALDEYKKTAIFAKTGVNRIEFETPCLFVKCAYLGGEFNVEVETGNDYAELAQEQYLLAMYNPGWKKYTLSPRFDKLSLANGWEKQGHVFYSGSAEIMLGEVEITGSEKLMLPSFKGIVELVIDGKIIERKALAPYVFELAKGRHNITLRVWNTVGNQLERFAVPSGITSPALLVR